MTLRRSCAGFVVLLVCWLSALPSAAAHTSIKESQPGAGDRVDATVDEIVVSFFHEVLATPKITVSGPSGDLVGEDATMLAAGTAVRVQLPALRAPGEYAVVVDFVSVDGDAQSQSFSFSIVEPSPAVATTSSSIDLEVLRVSLHVLAATIWVGGQLVLAGLVPTLRQLGDDAPAVVARRFNRIAWPAFGVLVATGLWNLTAVDLANRDSGYRTLLLVKLVVVAVSGVGAAVHIIGDSRRALAIGGAAAALGAVGAVVLGVSLQVG